MVDGLLDCISESEVGERRGEVVEWCSCSTDVKLADRCGEVVERVGMVVD